MSIRLSFRWYAPYMGIYLCRRSRRLYIMILPCVGFVVTFWKRSR